MSDKDVVEEARELIIELGQDRKSALCKAVTHKVIAAKAENLLRALIDEVERLRESHFENKASVREIQDCTKCDLCEGHRQ